MLQFDELQFDDRKQEILACVGLIVILVILIYLWQFIAPPNMDYVITFKDGAKITCEQWARDESFSKCEFLGSSKYAYYPNSSIISVEAYPKEKK